MSAPTAPRQRLTFDPAAELIWQTEAIEMLEAVRSRGFYDELHSLDWTVTSTGILRGTVPFGTIDASDVLTMWADVAEAGEVHTYVYGGYSHLRAYARRVYGSSVLVELTARVDGDGVAA